MHVNPSKIGYSQFNVTNRQALKKRFPEITMSNHDVRWIQKSNHFSKVLSQLKKIIDKGDLGKLEE